MQVVHDGQYGGVGQRTAALKILEDLADGERRGGRPDPVHDLSLEIAEVAHCASGRPVVYAGEHSGTREADRPGCPDHSEVSAPATRPC